MFNTYAEQLKVVLILSFAFMLMFTSYVSVEGIITKFYEDKGHQYFGPISLIIIYTFFALSTIYSSSLISTLGYRNIFILGALFYTLFESSALIIYFSNNQFILIFVILTTSVLCGCAAGNIWVAQNAYIGLIASQQNVNGFYGLTEGIRSISSVVGFLLSVYIFKNYSGLEYFIVIAPISMLSIVLFWMLPQPPSSKYQITSRDQSQGGWVKIRTYFKLLGIENNYQVYTYETLTSINVTLVVNFIYKIPKQAETQQEFQNRSTFLLAFVLLWFGIGRCITGFLIKYLPFAKDNFLFCQLTAWACLFSMLTALTSYLSSSYFLCCICSFLFGTTYTTSRTSCNILIKEIFHNNLDMIGINYFISSFAFVFCIMLIFILNKISILLCFAVFVFIFAVVVRQTRKIGVKFRPSAEIGTELVAFENDN